MFDRPSLFAVACALACALAGCRAPQAPSDAPLPELGAQAVVEPAPIEREMPNDPGSASPAPSPTGDAGSPTTPADDAAGVRDDDAPSSTTSGPRAGDDRAVTEAAAAGDGSGQGAAVERTLLRTADARADHGLEGPAWSDLRELRLDSVGEGLRLQLRFDAPLPATPPAGEVLLASVDLLRSDDSGADEQLFVVGNADGWYAHLYRGGGFVRYPGTFTITGSTMTLGVPWSSVGSPSRGTVRALVEWSRKREVAGIAANALAEDRLDRQPHAFDRVR